MTAKKLRVLLVEHSSNDEQHILSKLNQGGYDLEHQSVTDAKGLIAALATSTFDVVLCNDDGQAYGGLPALKKVQYLGVDIPFLFLSNDLREENILLTMHEGADDYIYKVTLNRLVPSIEHNLREARIRKEHRAAQLELQENQTRLHAFIADLPGMAYQILLGTDGSISFPYVSEGCHALLGIEPQDLIGNSKLFDGILHPEDFTSYQKSMRTSARQLSFWNWEGRILIQPEQEIKWINLRCSPRRTAAGVQWEGIMFNITQGKRAEVELRLSKQHLRELSSHINHVREEERIAIAREVHDDIGSMLTATKLDIAWLGKRLKDRPELAAKAKSIEELVDKCTRSASNISRSLRPSALDTFGIIAAIENEAHEFSQRTGIDSVFDKVDEHISLSPEVSIALFRIFQEALANITKHAKASKVSISMYISASCVDLIVRDNGCGISDADRRKPGSFGLRGIFERASHFGGDVKIESKPNMGTTLKIRIPHHAEPDKPTQPVEPQQTLFE
jgi:signal transduction histidine kinase